MIAAECVPSWGASTIRRVCGMTITAPESEPDTRERASDSPAAVDGVAGGGDRSSPGCGELRLVAAAQRDDARPVAAARRLRAAPPVQLELVSGREGPGPELVWASKSKEAFEGSFRFTSPEPVCSDQAPVGLPSA